MTRPSLSVKRWVLHGVLGLLFVAAGVGKFVTPVEQLQAGAVVFPVWFYYFIGVCETLGGIGLVVPVATGIAPGLTRLAAAGLSIIMVGATVTTAMGTPKTLAALPFVVLCLVASVAWTRR